MSEDVVPDDPIFVDAPPDAPVDAPADDVTGSDPLDAVVLRFEESQKTIASILEPDPNIPGPDFIEYDRATPHCYTVLIDIPSLGYHAGEKKVLSPPYEESLRDTVRDLVLALRSQP